MYNYILLILNIMILLSGSHSEMLDEDCLQIRDKAILTERDLDSICSYNFVYRFNNETYTVCECCTCDKASMAVNCDGDQLCDWTEDCMIDFFKHADLIGYVEF